MVSASVSVHSSWSIGGLIVNRDVRRIDFGFPELLTDCVLLLLVVQACKESRPTDNDDHEAHDSLPACATVAGSTSR